MGKAGIEARDTLQYFQDKYRTRNFIVTDVSIDANADRWKEAIVKDTVNWISYNDPNGWESRMVRGTNLQTAPAFVLFTGVKRVVLKSKSIEELDRELDKTLPKPVPKEEIKNNKNRKEPPKTKPKTVKL